MPDRHVTDPGAPASPLDTPQARVAEFVRQWGMTRGHDPSIVHDIWTDVNATPVSLTIEDLQALLAMNGGDAGASSPSHAGVGQ